METKPKHKVGARLGQGLGKVRARSGQKPRFGQGLGRQGLGKVRARSGQGLDKNQSLGKARSGLPVTVRVIKDNWCL